MHSEQYRYHLGTGLCKEGLTVDDSQSDPRIVRANGKRDELISIADELSQRKDSSFGGRVGGGGLVSFDQHQTLGATIEEQLDSGRGDGQEDVS